MNERIEDAEFGPEIPATSFSWWPDEPLQWALDRWIQLLGITFLLIGVGFLFKYTYDHGLLVPPLRVLCGAAIGGGLAIAGWRLRDTRRPLAHVLLGGASATLYVTLYAASELYSLIPGAVAFAGFIGVTMATFVVSITQRGVVLANIATIAAFLTPFVLDVPLVADPQLKDLGTIAYMCIVLTGSTAIYLFNGWRSLLVISAAAIWPYLGLVALGASTPLENGVAQAAIVFAWLATAVVPVARAYLSPGNRSDRTVAHICTLAVPGVAMLVSWLLWHDVDANWGIISLALAGTYAAASLFLRRDRDRFGELATTHSLVAAGLATLGFTAWFAGPTLMLALLIEGVVLCWAGFRLAPAHAALGAGSIWQEHRLFQIIGHALLATVLVDSVMLFVPSASGTPFLNPEGLQLVATSVGLWLVGQTHEQDAVGPGFEWAAHLLLLATILHQTGPMQYGDLVATACWGVYSLALITVGLTGRVNSRQWMGLSALLLTAGKLLFVDMSGAETLWRVLLFMAFGAALLFLSYLAPRWNDSGESPAEPPATA